jgi:hypothetical protein
VLDTLDVSGWSNTICNTEYGIKTNAPFTYTSTYEHTIFNVRRYNSTWEPAYFQGKVRIGNATSDSTLKVGGGGYFTGGLKVDGDFKSGEVKWQSIVVDSTWIVADSSYKITIFSDLPYSVTIDSIKSRGVGTTSLTPRYHYGSDISAVGTRIINSPAAVTASTTMNKVSSFDNATVTAGNAIWMVFQAVTTVPKNYNVTVYYHRN